MNDCWNEAKFLMHTLTQSLQIMMQWNSLHGEQITKQLNKLNQTTAHLPLPLEQALLSSWSHQKTPREPAGKMAFSNYLVVVRCKRHCIHTFSPSLINLDLPMVARNLWVKYALKQDLRVHVCVCVCVERGCDLECIIWDLSIRKITNYILLAEWILCSGNHHSTLLTLHALMANSRETVHKLSKWRIDRLWIVMILLALLPR